MSLWTPGGEHEVPRDQPQTPSQPDMSALAEAFDVDSLTPEQQAEAQAMLAEMAAVQERIASMPAADVITNHLMGLYELAAIHLSQELPNFREAALAIDALRLVSDGMKGRLGEHEGTISQALAQIQMAFVQLKGQTDEPSPAVE